MTQTVKHGIFIVSLVLSLGMLLFSHYAFAFSEMPFGGRITQTSTPGVTCMGTGPIQLQGVGQTGNGPYSTNQSSRSWVGSIGPSFWVKGFYRTGTDSTNCKTGQKPYEIPYPTTIWTKYGTSGGSFFGF